MDWTDIKLHVALKDRDTAAAIATLTATGGIYIEDFSDLLEEAPRIAHIDLIDEALLARDRENVVIHVYVAAEHNPAEVRLFMEERLTAAGVACDISSDTVAEEDWATAWKAHYRPVELSDKLIICPSWLDCEVKPGQQVLRLDPGMAFGTGTHETTRLCLKLLERALHPGDRVLDVGCGSGILSIAARLLGSGETAGVDIDAVAVRVAEENAAENGITDIAYMVGDLSAGIRGTYNIVMANIVADIILRLLPDLGAVLATGGAFIASGIIDTRADEVIAGIAGQGYRVAERLDEGGWVALLARREGQ